MPATRVARTIAAPRSAVYRAILDPQDVGVWMVPDDMTGLVEEFDAREGGRFIITLTYDGVGAGKTTDRTDRFSGRFVRLVADTEVVQEIAFDSDDPAMTGTMTVTYTLADVGGATRLTAVHDNLPPGLDPVQNEIGWTMSLDQLARLVEGRRR